MILSDRRIRAAVASGDIVIEPFDEARLGTNSYDVTLGRMLATYRRHRLDAREKEEVDYFEIQDEGLELVPGQVYLGITEQFVGSRKYVPWLDGKSSAGRLGIFVHVTAGRGDVGFHNHWTMEIAVLQPVTVYHGMPIGQFSFFTSAKPSIPYDKKPSAKYNERELHNGLPKPTPSRMWANFPANIRPGVRTP